MTALMEEIVRRVEALPEGEQEQMAAFLLHMINDDEEWRMRFANTHDVLDALEREALEEDARGETRPLEESI